MDDSSHVNNQNIGDDTDSEWDSTLEFTSPRQTGKITDEGPYEMPEKLGLNPTNDNQDVSDIEKQDKSHKPGTQQKVPKKQSPVEDSPGKARPKSQGDEIPPYNFRGALADDGDNDSEKRPPGKDKKGKMYDIPLRPASVTDIAGVKSWDDSEDEEKTLREVRANLKKQKRLDQEAKEARLQQQGSGKVDSSPNQPGKGWQNWGGYHDNPVPPARRSRNKESPRQDHPEAVRKQYNLYTPGHSGDDMNPDRDPPEVQQSVPLIVRDEMGKRFLYHFLPGNMRYYEVPETEYDAVMPRIADKVEKTVRRVWQEVFGALRILTSVFVIFVLEAVKYAFYYTAQPLAVGIISAMGDYLVKPVLSTVFNLILQPVFVFLWNILTGLTRVTRPALEISKRMISQVTMLLQSIRLIEINWKAPPSRHHYREMVQNV